MVSVFKWQLRNTNVDTDYSEGIEICGKRDYLVSFLCTKKSHFLRLEKNKTLSFVHKIVYLLQSFTFLLIVNHCKTYLNANSYPFHAALKLQKQVQLSYGMQTFFVHPKQDVLSCCLKFFFCSFSIFQQKHYKSFIYSTLIYSKLSATVNYGFKW